MKNETKKFHLYYQWVDSELTKLKIEHYLEIPSPNFQPNYTQKLSMLNKKKGIHISCLHPRVEFSSLVYNAKTRCCQSRGLALECNLRFKNNYISRNIIKLCRFWNAHIFSIFSNKILYTNAKKYCCFFLVI